MISLQMKCIFLKMGSQYLIGANKNSYHRLYTYIIYIFKICIYDIYDLCIYSYIYIYNLWNVELSHKMENN